MLEKIMKIWYFENTHRDESKDILYDIIYLCILVEKYDQSKLGQNCTFSNVSSIAGRREYCSKFILREFKEFYKWEKIQRRQRVGVAFTVSGVISLIGFCKFDHLCGMIVFSLVFLRWKQ